MEIRVYAECLEQGLDFKEYLHNINSSFNIKNIYPTKARGNITTKDSILQKITKLKDFDVIITIVSHNQETPILLVEYSTAVPTDDHKMQRSDVYFYSSLFKIPVLKISPHSKGLSNNHGGGDKITLIREQNLTLKINALVYFIEWESENDLLLTNPKRNSCIPYNTKIENILKNILSKHLNSTALNFYDELLSENMQYFDEKHLAELKASFSNSTRFQKENEKLIVKINRFGHAMDPDRGILFFVNALFEGENIITKIIIKRERQSGKESYDSLFDGLSTPIQDKLQKLIKQDFNADIALEVFKTATNINVLCKKKNSNHFEIEDNDFKDFLENYNSITYKSIFINSSCLRLCDTYSNIICELSWNANVAKEYLLSLKGGINNATTLYPFTMQNAKEDIITFASVVLLQKIGAKILSVSYPGAQGDKAILIGNGRQTKRIYVDIIAHKDSKKCFVLLQENKEKKNDLRQDEKKLLDIKDNHFDSLQELFHKIHTSYIEKDSLYLGLGSKFKLDSISPFFSIDYIFAFEIYSCDKYTNILWNVAIINLDLIHLFKPLLNAENKLQGMISLDLIYKA